MQKTTTERRKLPRIDEIREAAKINACIGDKACEVISNSNGLLNLVFGVRKDSDARMEPQTHRG